MSPHESSGADRSCARVTLGAAFIQTKNNGRRTGERSGPSQDGRDGHVVGQYGEDW